MVEYGQGLPWTRHCHAVADAAQAVGELLTDQRAIDVDSLWSVALLHDIGRYVTHDPILHGVEGYKLLMDLCHEEAAFVCASHIGFGLLAAEAAQYGLPAQDFVPRTRLERIVPLVDFLLEGEQPTTLESRFTSLRKRNTGNDSFLEMLHRAQGEATSFLAELDAEIGCSVVEVVATSVRDA
ncbi:MAG: HD domain-containing protein [Candidatus Marinimicrobia bacterium]|nr:HD domain-containing protein [Candidatus Neomarinimicrobiota bacterium]